MNRRVSLSTVTAGLVAAPLAAEAPVGGVGPRTRRPAVIVRTLAILAVTILIAGCESAAPVYVYSRPGATLEQMTRDEAECAGGTGGGQVSAARLRRCMAERGYVAQELRQGSYLELREMKIPAQSP